MTWLLDLAGWLLGSKTGRTIVLIGLVVLGTGLTIWQAFRSGRKAEQSAQASRTLEALREKVKVHDEVMHMSVDDRRRALRQWVRE